MIPARESKWQFVFPHPGEQSTPQSLSIITTLFKNTTFLLLLEKKQVSSGKVELLLVSESRHRSLCYLIDWFTLPWSVNPKAFSFSLYSSFIFVSLSPQCQSAGLLVCWLGYISEISVSPLSPPLGLPNVVCFHTALGRGSFSWLTLCFPLLPLGSAANRAHNWLVRSWKMSSVTI